MIVKLLAALIALVPAASATAQAVRDFSTAPAAAGAWAYRAVPGGSEARFADATGIARLVIGCTKATRRVNVSPTAASAAPTISVWTSSASRVVAVRFEQNAMRLTADLAAFDPLLDAIAFSRGRVAVTVNGTGVGAVSLVVPAGPEAARTIEDCRI